MGWLLLFIIGFVIATLVSVVYRLVMRPGGIDVSKQSGIVITGGSQGLGLETASLCVKAGAPRVTICARNKATLEKARDRLLAERVSDSQRVSIFVGDVTDDALVLPECSLLICCAGYSHPLMFLETDSDMWLNQWKCNCMGVVNCVRSVLPSMITNRRGHIVVTSSTMALIGLAGYSAYSSAKWAVRGFIECLHNELQCYGGDITVHHYYPSTMDTPGLARENLSKPRVTTELEDGNASLTAEEGAQGLLVGLSRGHASISADWITEMFRMGAQSVTPHNNFMVALLLSPFVTIFSKITRIVVDRTARSHRHTL